MKLKCLVGLFVFLSLVCSLLAETAIWTGAQDAFWTNANNWVQSDGVTPVMAAPGVCCDGSADVDPASAVYDTALFNRASANTVIDLSGLYAVRNITVDGAETPVYTFGASPLQTIRLVSEAQCASYNNGGVFKVGSSVVNMPVLRAVLSLRCSGTLNEGIHITNQTKLPLVIGDIGRFVDASPLGVYPDNIKDSSGALPSWAKEQKTGNAAVLLDGSGPFQLTGSFIEIPANRYGAFFVKTTSGLTVPKGCTVANVHALGIMNTTSLNLEENSAFVFSPGGDFTVSSGTGFVTRGEGLFALQGKASGNAGTVVYIYHGRPWTSQSCLAVTNFSGAAQENTEFLYGGVGKAGENGVINFQGENTFAGTYTFHGKGTYAGPRYVADRLGADGEPGPLGYTSRICLANNGTFVYTGDGETSSRTFSIVTGKESLGGNTMALEQSGSGVWTVESRILQECAEATLVLRNPTAHPAVFARALGGETYNGAEATLSVRKEGVGEWRLSAANKYMGATTIAEGTLTIAPGGDISKSSALIMEGGTLEVSGATGGRSVALPPVTVNTEGIATLYVNGEADVSVETASCVRGRLNICTAGEGALVRIKGFAGTSPEWLRYNGSVVEVAEDGTLSAGDERVSVTIPARGGVLQDDAAASVGITEPGTAGPITLAGSSVSVSNLIQQSRTEATVDLAGGEIIARRIMIDRGERAPLTVGVEAGDGEVKALDGMLVLENLSTNGSVLAVSAKIDVPSNGSLAKRGAGPVRIGQPLDFSGTLAIESGELSVANATNIAQTLSGAGVFVKEGPSFFSLPDSVFPDFSGEIRMAGGTNALPRNYVLKGTGYFLRFLPGSSIAGFSKLGAYDTEDTMIHVAGDGVDGNGVLCLDVAGNARVFPFMTLDGDASINARHETCWIQIAGSDYSKRAGVLDMQGHRLLKRDGAGEFRFADGGQIVNPGEIVVDHFTGTSGVSTVRLVGGFSLGGAGAPPLTLGSNTRLISENAVRQDRSLRVNGANAEVRIAAGNSNADVDSWNGLEIVSPGDSLSIFPIAAGDWKIDFRGALSGSGDLTLGGSTKVNGIVNFRSPANDFDGKITVRAGTRVYFSGGFGEGASPDLIVNDGVVAAPAGDMSADQVDELVSSVTTGAAGRFMLSAGYGSLPDLSKYEKPLTLVVGDAFGVARTSLSGSRQSWTIVNDDKEHYKNASGGDDFYAKAIVVGDCGSGILEILEGAAATNRLIIGGNYGSPRGAVYQRGGYFCSLGGVEDALSAAGLALGESSKAYAYYELSGGTLEMMGGHSFCANGASGVFYVNGGDIITTRRPAQCNPFPTWRPSLNLPYNGKAVFFVADGHVNLSDCNVLTCRGGSSPSLVLTVSGENARFTAATMFRCGYSPTATTIVNIADGGVFRAPYIDKYQANNGAKAFVNFNGGTFVTTTSDAYWVFGAGSSDCSPKVTVFRGGATVETPYENYKPKIWKISGPTGKGVASVSMGNLAEMTLVGSPRVSIEGDGWGASAYAEFDSLSGKVTGIRVTSPGCDYTFATASVHYGDTVLAEGLEVALEENVGGAFTKTGPGTLTLMATNTWCGATVVKDGVLTAGTDGAIPPATRLVLDGGTIDLGGFDFSFAGISGSGGTVAGGTAKIAGEWVVDGAELATNRMMKSFTTVSGDVEIEPGSRMRITGFDELDGAKVYRILRMAQGTLSGVENLVCDLPHGWRLLRSASGLAISKVKSVTVIVR